MSAFGHDQRHVAVLRLVGISGFYGHAVEGVEREAAGVAAQDAARDVPVRVAEGEARPASGLLHGFSTTVAASFVLPVQCFCFPVLSGENVFVPFERSQHGSWVKLNEVRRNSCHFRKRSPRAVVLQARGRRRLRTSCMISYS